MKWSDITPEDAAAQKIDCRQRPDLDPPRNEMGEVCPFPWDPQRLLGAPIGQYRCPYCGAMIMAGMEHLDYSDDDDGPMPPPAEEEGSIEGWPPGEV